MKDEDRTKEQLINELLEMRKRITEFEVSETERKRADEELRGFLDQIERAKQEWEVVADSLPQVICLLDNQGLILRANLALERWNLGWVADVKGLGMHELFHPGCTDSSCYMYVFWTRAWEELTQDRPTEFEVEDRVLKRCLHIQALSILPYKRTKSKTAEAFAVAIVDDITEHKQVEEQILRQSATLDTINRVFRETLRCETDKEVAHTCLAVVEELIGSKFGFIGEVNESGCFDTIALSDPGWETCRIPKSDAVRMIKDMEIRGIWGRVLKDGRSLIVNDPPSHPDRVGTPEGHPPLTSFLGVPLKREGKTIGMIALANKEGGYNLADQEDIEALSVVFLEALIRKRAEEKIQRSSQIQTTLNKILHLSLENISLEEMLERVIDHIIYVPFPWVVLEPKGAIFLVEDDPEVLVIKAQRGLAAPLLKTCNRVPFGRCLCGRAALSGKIEFSNCIDERHENRYDGIISHGHYCVPIISAEKVLGVINLYSKEGHARDQKEEEFLSSVANTMAGVIERKKLEEEVKKKMHELERFHKVAVGRELKMVELKNRIKELEAKSGKRG